MSHRIKKNVQIESVLHSFTNTPDGDEPHDALTNVGGTLYGTTYYGGASGNGTVFKSTTSGTESVLYSFAGGSDGANPATKLTNVGSTLYGMTERGGSSGFGTIFSLSL